LVDCLTRKAFNKVEQGERLEAEWRNMFDNYAAQYPDLAAELNRRVSRQV
jgi:transketolase